MPTEADILRANFAKYLAPEYAIRPATVAALCDERLDRSGQLLWLVRKAAAPQTAGEGR